MSDNIKYASKEKCSSLTTHNLKNLDPETKCKDCGKTVSEIRKTKYDSTNIDYVIDYDTSIHHNGAGIAGGIIGLIAGVGVATLVLIFLGVVTDTVDDGTNYSDATIKGHVKESITDGFEAVNEVGSYLHYVILAIVFTLILSLIGVGTISYNKT